MIPNLEQRKPGAPANKAGASGSRKMIFRADIIEGLIWFIVMIIWIGSKISKAQKTGKKSPSSAGPQGHDPSISSTAYIAPEEELRRFLLSISSSPQEAKPAEPERMPVQPAPLPPRHTARPQASGNRPISSLPKPTKRTTMFRKQVADQEQPLPIPAVATRKPRRKIVARSTEPDHFAEKIRGNTAIKMLRNRLGDDLIKSASLKKAILLKEILDRPLALR